MVSGMNRYGQQAMAHWQQFLPRSIARISSPTEFFSELGQQVADEIDTLADQIAGPARPQETYLQTLGRLREARLSAESTVLREQVLLAPETDTALTDTSHPDTQQSGGLTSEASAWAPLRRDLSDPSWQSDLRHEQDLRD